MTGRKSADVYEQLQKLPVQDKGRAIVLAAARMGKSQADVVRLLVKDVLKLTTVEQAREIAPTWAPLLELKPERFVEIAQAVLSSH